MERLVKFYTFWHKVDGASSVWVRTYGNDTLVGQSLDLRLAVLLPVADVFVVSDTERSASEDDGADIVVEAGGSDGFLVSLGGTGLVGENKSRSDPDGRCAQHQRCGQRLSVEDTTCSNELDWFTCEFGVGCVAQNLGNSWNEDSSGNITL